MEISDPKKPVPPIKISEEIQVSLNRLGRDLETHAESGIRIGKELIYLKEITPHGQFGELVEWAYGLKKHTRTNYMNVAVKFGEKSTRVDFSNRVLIELSRPSVPKTARDEAEQYEKLTVKQAKDLVNAHKRIKELESVREPNLDNLIPELHKKYKGSSITIGRANRLSVLDKGQQQIFLSLLSSKEFADQKKDKLSEEKLRLLESIEKTTRERDEVKEQLKALENSDTGTILLEKEQALKEARADYDRRVIDERKKASKEASELHEKLNKDKIIEAEKKVEKAERNRKEQRENASAAYKAQGELEIKIKRLEEQLEVNNPTNVDLAMEKQVQSITNSVQFVLRQLRNDMLTIGGGMDKSIKAVTSLNEGIAQSLSELVDDSEKIININGV